MRLERRLRYTVVCLCVLQWPGKDGDALEGSGEAAGLEVALRTAVQDDHLLALEPRSPRPPPPRPGSWHNNHEVQWETKERKRGVFMLAVPGGGGLGAERDRQVRLRSVSTDLELGLPPSIPLPDGEELPYGSSNRLHIRDSQQESEIYQKCIRAPPNRTVLEGESPPPYRSASAGALSSPPHDWTVIRSNSVSNRSPPTVQVPAGKRLSALTMVPCLVDTTTPAGKPKATSTDPSLL